jgi:GTP pyrophosphokinase
MHILKNGQQVEIITSRKQTAKDEWLTYVVTTRAKSNIKLTLRAEKRRFSKIGKEKLGKWFHQLNIPFTHENIRKFLLAGNFNTLIDLYYAAAKDNIGIKDVKLFASSTFRSGWINFISKDTALDSKEKADKKPPATETSTQKTESGKKRMVVRDNFEVASCCNPIPGDEVIGLVASDSMPVQIHRNKCVKAQELMTVFGNKTVPVNWSQKKATTYKVEIKITGLDKKGLINEITRIISNDLDLNIKAFNIEAMNGLTFGLIILYVSHIANLKDVINKIKQIEGITHVARIE